MNFTPQPTLTDTDIAVIMDALACYADYLEKGKVPKQNPALYAQVMGSYARVRTFKRWLAKSYRGDTIPVIKRM